MLLAWRTVERYVFTVFEYVEKADLYSIIAASSAALSAQAVTLLIAALRLSYAPLVPNAASYRGVRTLVLYCAASTVLLLSCEYSVESSDCSFSMACKILLTAAFSAAVTTPSFARSSTVPSRSLSEPCSSPSFVSVSPSESLSLSIDSLDFLSSSPTPLMSVLFWSLRLLRSSITPSTVQPPSPYLAFGDSWNSPVSKSQ